MSKSAYLAQEAKEERMREHAEEMYLILKHAIVQGSFYADKNLAGVKALLAEIEKP